MFRVHSIEGRAAHRQVVTEHVTIRSALSVDRYTLMVETKMKTKGQNNIILPDLASVFIDGLLVPKTLYVLPECAPGTRETKPTHKTRVAVFE